MIRQRVGRSQIIELIWISWIGVPNAPSLVGTDIRQTPIGQRSVAGDFILRHAIRHLEHTLGWSIFPQGRRSVSGYMARASRTARRRRREGNHVVCCCSSLCFVAKVCNDPIRPSMALAWSSSDFLVSVKKCRRSEKSQTYGTCDRRTKIRWRFAFDFFRPAAAHDREGKEGWCSAGNSLYQ